MATYEELSKEQQQFIDYALSGKDVLVDACIGSGKTTAIQTLCQCFSPFQEILYLTYNKLLKIDAMQKIQSPNVRVTNYNTFVYRELADRDIYVGISQQIEEYLNRRIPTPHYDVLIIDEYQDIRQEHADLLLHIRKYNPDIQIIAVGDMAQKIYDDTTLKADAFLRTFMRQDVIFMEFTQCFRINKQLANQLGKIWNKKIVGVNQHCIVEELSFTDTLDVLINAEPSQILCLGANQGDRTTMLNLLEEFHPEKYNKTNSFSKISGFDNNVSPEENNAIFTTFDGCKGMERDICVIFDWTLDYWIQRNSYLESNYEILRNIFCVAASRGKSRIIFVKPENHTPLKFDMLAVPIIKADDEPIGMYINTLFQYKRVEDIRKTRKLVETQHIQPPQATIRTKTKDALIDLMPAIATWLNVSYFSDMNIEQAIEDYLKQTKREYEKRDMRKWSHDRKVLRLCQLQTKQNRYAYQVELPFLKNSVKDKILQRLASKLSKDDRTHEYAQIEFSKNQNEIFYVHGTVYLIQNHSTVFLATFSSDIDSLTILTCALQVCAAGTSHGIIWNLRTDECLLVRVPDPDAFLTSVYYTATKQKADPSDQITCHITYGPEE